jgi:hypothetical protein
MLQVLVCSSILGGITKLRGVVVSTSGSYCDMFVLSGSW